MTKNNALSPEDDGVTHLNIGAGAKTWLGRELSTGAHRPFKHYEHGTFASVEGYSLWLTRQSEALRELHGQEATSLGLSLPVIKTWPKDKYLQHINVANASKINAHSDLKAELIKSTLPLEQYSVDDSDGHRAVIIDSNSDDTLAYIEGLRREENPEADISHCHKILERFRHVDHLIEP